MHHVNRIDEDHCPQQLDWIEGVRHEHECSLLIELHALECGNDQIVNDDPTLPRRQQIQHIAPVEFRRRLLIKCTRQEQISAQEEEQRHAAPPERKSDERQPLSARRQMIDDVDIVEPVNDLDGVIEYDEDDRRRADQIEPFDPVFNR